MKKIDQLIIIIYNEHINDIWLWKIENKETKWKVVGNVNWIAIINTAAVTLPWGSELVYWFNSQSSVSTR